MQRTSWESFRRRLAELAPRERRVLLGVLSAAAAVFLVPLAFAAVFLAAAPRFPRAPFQQPSRLYGRPAQLATGSSGSAQDLLAELAAAGYREAPAEPADRELPPGTFRQAGDAVAFQLRRHPTPAGTAGGATVEAVFARRDGSDRIASLRVGGKAAQAVELEPPLLASYFGPEMDERRPFTLDELPDRVPHAVLAAEDDGFYSHPGVSPSGILRAAWANLRGGQIHQGGSTLTQQLVKNLYLTQKRTLSRKAREAVIALLIEMRYGKRAILEAYLNEIYWGKSGSANLIGLGAAAHAFFGKEASELTLAEAATLAGIIRAPGEYSPVAHPERAIERRNHVLQRMADLGWAKREDALAAERQPLALYPQPVLAHRTAPYFAGAAAAEARERFGIEELEDKGYLLFSTLGRREQAQAEEAVAQGLAGLEKGPERRHGGDEPLQAALLSADPRDGAILAYVGGRDHSASQFDRIAQAHRQAGSAFKPVIYAAAFADSVALPTSLVNDSPILVRMGDQTWQPQDYDHDFRGWVTVRTALEQSLNVPTVRLSLQVGLPRVVSLGQAMGIAGRLEPMPALALGAFEVTPRELAEVYATLASGGLRPPLHGLAAVVDRAGEPVVGKDLPAPSRVLDPQAAYLVTSVLQGVLDRGTAQGARSQGVRGELAGKTGTTTGRRDNWFAGYSPDRVTVVWVGYDDNAKSRLSGSSAALPIWSRYVRAMRPAEGYPAFPVPPGVVTATVDPSTGQLATAACPFAVTDVFPDWQVPTQPCTRHLLGGENDPWRSASLGPALDAASGGTGAGGGQDEAGTILIRRSAPQAPNPGGAAGDETAQEDPRPPEEGTDPPPSPP